ncbi:hypothetical protein CROQUDRAFT_98885 [Cronartium quercuum f. sp. fusiforme G11]|uniref:Uncharacterized protein n=1 Tax=Cronartium quercuum f. sp. fusiforme G11 TaxID=708437 RepID=A0A9P6N7J0_9BASI|nr:hypothetical protein CROQUDRAFT_98885 [Cronartium quercuum f. sp. fusiforme G11]
MLFTCLGDSSALTLLSNKPMANQQPPRTIGIGVGVPANPLTSAIPPKIIVQNSYGTTAHGFPEQ